MCLSEPIHCPLDQSAFNQIETLVSINEKLDMKIYIQIDWIVYGRVIVIDETVVFWSAWPVCVPTADTIFGNLGKEDNSGSLMEIV